MSCTWHQKFLLTGLKPPRDTTKNFFACSTYRLRCHHHDLYMYKVMFNVSMFHFVKIPIFFLNYVLIGRFLHHGIPIPMAAEETYRLQSVETHEMHRLLREFRLYSDCICHCSRSTQEKKSKPSQNFVDWTSRKYTIHMDPMGYNFD